MLNEMWQVFAMVALDVPQAYWTMQHNGIELSCKIRCSNIRQYFAFAFDSNLL